ncbi:T9SS type B sorting domain-containing protein [uncultured Algibacter sp.]|uniref:T9SS type B sorting domain-containing protein n=1 Tax=uncultured Algibacter sp. TaxID=298659 RepID=UPI0026322221|nr:T9SS type B sorting domain-containing protein [uncultured Algibacter sp.]
MVISFYQFYAFAQTPLYQDVKISDNSSVDNSIGEANTSRNIAVNSKGEIYIVYQSRSSGIKVSKSSNRGQSFSPSVLVSNTYGEAEIAINQRGDVFIAWLRGNSVQFSKSTDGGITYSDPRVLGSGEGDAVHMATYDNMIYIIDRLGKVVYFNDNYGEGAFITKQFDGYVYADVRTDSNGIVYVPADDPRLFLFKSEDSGITFSSINFQNFPSVFFSSYALSEGPCGDFIFVGGGGATTNTTGYKIDVNSGESEELNLGANDGSETGRTLVADNKGTLIDGYKNSNGELLFNVSYDQGETFGMPVLVAEGRSHNLEINQAFNDVVVVYSKNNEIYASVYDNILKGITIESPILGTLCSGSSIDFTYNLLGEFEMNTEFSVFLSDSNGSFSNGTLLASVSTDISGNIKVTLPSDMESSDLYKIKFQSTENCTESNLISLSISKPNIELQESYSICESQQSLNLRLDSSFLTYSWTYEDGSLISDTFEVSISEKGTYAVYVTSDINGSVCENSFDFELKYDQFPEINDVKVTEVSGANSIEIISKMGSLLEYSLDGINYQDSNVFYNLAGGEYKVYFRDKKCLNTVIEDVFILDYPRFFTPNGDGVNDIWRIEGLQKFPNAMIFVYDRYGKLLKQFSASSNGWNGTFNGVKLLPSDYWFVANLNSTRRVKGHFTLKR